MDDELRRALTGLAHRGRDADPRSAWDAAIETAQRRRRARRVRTTIAGALALVLVGATGAITIAHRDTRSVRVVVVPPTTEPAPLPANELIAYTRDFRIWAVAASATSPPHAISTRGCCSVSAWNPNHTLIAVNDREQIAILRPDGTRVRTLDASTSFAPSWSPDGRRLAFAASPAGASNGGPIEIIDVDGHHAPRTVARVFAGRVAWSPDGTRIAFTALDEPLHINILTLATGTVTRLTQGPGTEQWDPAWSAANGRIAFASTAGVYEIRADGSGLRRVASSSRPCCNLNSPSWSPDGTKIVFGITVTGFQELVVADVASGKQIELTSGPSGGTSPAW
jgi:Tol biopolymer transport system component